MADWPGGVGRAPGGVCCITEDPTGFDRRSEAVAGEAIQAGKLQRGKSAQNVGQRLQKKIGAGPGNVSGTEVKTKRSLLQRIKMFSIYDLTCQKAAPPAPAESN